MGILSLRHFLGFDLSADAAIEDAVKGETLSYLLPIPLPDFTMIGFAALAIVLYILSRKILKKNAFVLTIGTVGLVVTMLCLVLSFTPVATAAPILVSSFRKTGTSIVLVEKEGTAYRPKKNGGYTVSDFSAEIKADDPEYPEVYITATVTNTSSKDWDGKTYVFYAVLDDGSYGQIPLSHNYTPEKTIKSGESVEISYMRILAPDVYGDHKPVDLELIRVDY